VAQGLTRRLTNRRTAAVLVVFAAIVINLPLAHSTWFGWRLDRDGVDTEATVVETRRVPPDADGRYYVEFRLSRELDPEQREWVAQVDADTFERARADERIGVRVLPDRPSEYETDGQQKSSVLWLITLLGDVMLVGSNTVAVDDPRLTVRDEHDQPLPHQPLRVVMGERDLDPGRRIFDDEAESLHLRTRDPRVALEELFARDRQHVFLEGGPTLAAAFLRAGLVDEVVTYVAPMLLGAGRKAVGDLGITTISDALHLRVEDVTVLDDNVRLRMRPHPEGRD